MKKLAVKNLAQIIEASHESQATSHDFVTGVSIDSRTTSPGDCFFAVPGENFDGHDYLPQAFDNGAVCAVVSKETKNKQFPDKTILRVTDTLKALGCLAQQYRRQTGFKVLAITGSVGKTTTRQIAYNILSCHFRVSQAPKNFNNNIGLPLTLLVADPTDKIVLTELATNHPGEIAYLTQIAQPDIAVVTNVYPAHLESFGSLQEIVHEKLSIAEGLKPDGTLIINADCPDLLDACIARGLNFTTFGKSEQCDIQARNISFNELGSRLTIHQTQLQLPLPGPGNVENALAAWAICRQLGITLQDFARDIKTIPAVPMRAQILQIGTLTVLNDCYNANPASMKNALEILTKIDPTKNRRLVFICADMAELGAQTQRFHAELGASVAQAKIQLLLTVGKFAKITAQTAEATAQYDLQTKSFEDTLSACNNLKKFIKDYDIVLVKGSRVAKLEMATEKLKEILS
jgi:UDP-N-acetylmuramoyl-tripeptide--D-alanyl-D-alanine ligase